LKIKKLSSDIDIFIYYCFNIERKFFSIFYGGSVFIVKKNGIALISTIMIVSILVMIMVSMVFILTNSTYMTGRYIDDNIAIQVAEAGVAYAIRQLNANPSWRGDVLDESGIYRQTDIYLPDIKGKFYITFNPSKDYCSCNNLKKPSPLQETVYLTELFHLIRER